MWEFKPLTSSEAYCTTISHNTFSFYQLRPAQNHSCSLAMETWILESQILLLSIESTSLPGPYDVKSSDGSYWAIPADRSVILLCSVHFPFMPWSQCHNLHVKMWEKKIFFSKSKWLRPAFQITFFKLVSSSLHILLLDYVNILLGRNLYLSDCITCLYQATNHKFSWNKLTN